MAIILGGVALSDHMVWADEIGSEASIAQTMKRTLGGTPVIQYQQLDRGRPITLTAVSDQGWLTKPQVEAVEALARQPGLITSLIIGSDTYSVMFRHHEPPAFTAVALDQVGAQAPDTGYYLATINLMTV